MTKRLGPINPKFLRGTVPLKDCPQQKFEPVAEPASTGEPTLNELVDQYWGPPLHHSEPAAPQTSPELCGHICKEPKGDHKHAIVLPPIVRPEFQVEPDEDQDRLLAELEKPKTPTAEMVDHLLWALDIMQMYEGRLIQFGDPPTLVYSDVHKKRVAEARRSIQDSAKYVEFRVPNIETRNPKE